jgi:hypothetical protein
MRKMFPIAMIVVLAATAGLATPSFARRGADDPKGHVRGEGIGHPLKPMMIDSVFARNGADDGANHDAGDDHGQHGAGHR